MIVATLSLPEGKNHILEVAFHQIPLEDLKTNDELIIHLDFQTFILERVSLLIV